MRHSHWPFSATSHFVGLAALAVCWWIPKPSVAETDRPNIVLIMADDLGFADLGCYGSEIETPNLDRLAEGGLRMTQFYNTAKCHSSRVSLLTGLYCDQAGAESLKHGTTIARELSRGGYFTAMSGKWHLDGEPTEQGFDRYFGHLSGATNYFTGDNSFRLNGAVWDDFDENFYTTIRDTDFGIQFIEEALEESKPFFLYLAYNAPHYPLQPLKVDYEKYLGKYDVGWDVVRAERISRQKQLGLFPKGTITDLPRPAHVPAWEDLSAEEQGWESSRMAAYAGMVDRLDQEIGRLIEYLKQKGVYDNTLLVFVSDNGACPFDRTKGKELEPFDSQSYWTYDTGWAHVGNVPFRYYKQNSHEGGIASPAIFHWPQVIGSGSKVKPNSLDATPAHLIDLMATCLDVAGVNYPDNVAGRPIDPLMGLSLKPVLVGTAMPERPYMYFHFSTNRALRIKDWKAVSLRGGPWELYDLAADRNEARNLAGEHPQVLEQLSEKWFEVAREVDRLPANGRKPAGTKPQDALFRKDGTQAKDSF